MVIWQAWSRQRCTRYACAPNACVMPPRSSRCCIPPRRASRYLRRLSKLQDRLGTLNDGAVAASLLAELGESGGGHAFAIGLVLGFLGANSVRVRARIEQSWDRFSRSAAFWE